jgi:hypothetical protein
MESKDNIEENDLESDVPVDSCTDSDSENNDQPKFDPTEEIEERGDEEEGEEEETSKKKDMKSDYMDKIIKTLRKSSEPVKSGIDINFLAIAEYIAAENYFAALSRLRLIMNSGIEINRSLNVDCYSKFSECPPVREILDLGIVPHIIVFLQDSNNPLMQFSAAWCITELTAGSTENTDEVIAAGVIPPLVQNLSSSDFGVVEQSIKALGNISFSSIASRDLVLTQPILPIFTALASSRLLKTLAWTLSNLFRGQPAAKFRILRPFFHIVKSLLFSSDLNDEAVIAELLWGLSSFTDGEDEQIEKFINLGFLPKIMEYLTSSEETIKIPALRIIGNCLTGSNPTFTTRLIKLGIFPVFMSFLDINSENATFPRETCWALSNITAGTIEQVQAVIDYGFFPKLLTMLQKRNTPVEITNEIVWVFCNVTDCGSLELIYYLFDHGIVEILLEMLMISDVTAVDAILDAMKNILQKFPSEFHDFKQKLHNLGIENALVPLQDHPSEMIFTKVTNLLRYLQSTEYPFNPLELEEKIPDDEGEAQELLEEEEEQDESDDLEEDVDA